MWTRSELKERAKAALQLSYWKAFAVSLVMGAVAGGGGVTVSRMNANTLSASGEFDMSGPAATFLLFFFAIIIIGSLISLGIKIFIGYPLLVGGQKYYIDATNHKFELNALGMGFKEKRYSGIIKGMLWKDILIFLWTLLLIIPGIIKSYEYSMVPFILAENPHINYREAIEMSKAMTRNQKFDIFVLDLSFIGWILLGMMACFIGVIFVTPYIYSTKAELYIHLRDKAINEGSIDPSKLNHGTDVLNLDKI